MQGGYDYIVIGSGSSGAVVAARLSEDPGVSVLLLEAGPRDRHPLQQMPLAFPRVALGKIGTWQFESEPEPALNGRTLGIPRGRTLGGTSSVNAMIAIRGNRRDYDDWAAQGLAGWSFEEVLPYFQRLESHWRGASEWHGGDGPIRISRVEGPDLLWEQHLAAAAALGIPYRDDPNAGEQDGISQMEATVARLVQGQPTIWFPAAFLARYPPEKRAGHRFAAALWQNTILLYSLATDGHMAVLEAVIEHLPVEETRHAA